MGATVDEVTVYETWQAENSGDELVRRLEEGTIDMVTFTSSSTVKNFCKLLPQDAAQRLMKGVAVASIGPITSRTAKGLGMAVTIEAESYTIPGLIQAILNDPWQRR
jgi:uroporphyrinogen III methyltransferase/synthase